MLHPETEYHFQRVQDGYSERTREGDTAAASDLVWETYPGCTPSKNGLRRGRMKKKREGDIFSFLYQCNGQGEMKSERVRVVFFCLFYSFPDAINACLALALVGGLLTRLTCGPNERCICTLCAMCRVPCAVLPFHIFPVRRSIFVSSLNQAECIPLHLPDLFGLWIHPWSALYIFLSVCFFSLSLSLSLFYLPPSFLPLSLISLLLILSSFRFP